MQVQGKTTIRLLAASALAAATLAAGLPADAAAQDSNCPENIDRARRDGAPEPREGQYCMPQPQAGRSVCSRRSSAPSRVRLRFGRAAGGVRLGMTAAGVCRRWGRPAVVAPTDRDAYWIYGSAAPSPEEWITYQRAVNKLSWIVSDCRYNTESCAPRDDERRRVAASGGPLADLIDLGSTRVANWLHVRFDPAGEVVEIASWRPRDRGPAGTRPGGPLPTRGASCVSLPQRNQGINKATICPLGRKSVSGLTCTSAYAASHSPITYDFLRYGAGTTFDFGSRVRTVGISRYLLASWCG